ncbi:MAG TPA: iron ABC transporter permease, partial [Burkholderiales bacterium]|nr:iron ABC transporter permease [Burkholderiales bacterium]
MAPSRTRLTWTLILIVGFLTVCPVVMLLLGSFSEGLTAFGNFTLDKYVQAYTDPGLLEVMVNTTVFVIASSTLSTLLALFLAYLNTRTDIPFKFVFKVISIIPMMIPHLLFSVSWALLLNPSNGMMNIVLKNALSLDGSPFNIYSMQGMILVEGLLDLPI